MIRVSIVANNHIVVSIPTFNFNHSNGTSGIGTAFLANQRGSFGFGEVVAAIVVEKHDRLRVRGKIIIYKKVCKSSLNSCTLALALALTVTLDTRP
jgi:hypothetical protein